MPPPRDHFRAHARRRAFVDVVVRGEALTPRTAELRDLGFGGACVDLSPEGPRDRLHELELDDDVTLEITAPTRWDPLEVRGTIAWRQRVPRGGIRVGVRFVHEDPAAVLSLLQLLAAHAQEA